MASLQVSYTVSRPMPMRQPPPPRLVPAQPTRFVQPKGRDIAPTIPVQRSPQPRTSQGRKTTLAREGILPAVPKSISNGTDEEEARKTAEAPRATEGNPARPPAKNSRTKSNVGDQPLVKKRSQPMFPANDEQKKKSDQFGEMIEQEILDRSPGVQWEDIASLNDAKRLLNEAVILPQLMPSFFTGIRSPWKGVLLFGPPGTGKTMLAKAVATCAKTTFFNMSSAVLLSRYHGESEKLVKALFEKAREHAPSTIFFDEIDALVGSRGEGSEHEVTRRVKTELLMQIDGVSSIGEKRIMILATTNRPWDIDEAMRRRLEKRIYVPLPDSDARRDLLKIHTKGIKVKEDIDFDAIVQSTEGYSGADVQSVCREASMMPLRKAIAGLSPQDIAERSAAIEESHSEMEVSQADFQAACERCKSSVGSRDLDRYASWFEEFGSA